MRSRYIAALIVAVLIPAVPASAADKVNMSFSFGKAGKDAGVYVAMEKGYFAKAGIDLTVTAGRGSGAAVTNVETGNSQFAETDFGNIIAARQKGGTVKSVMLMYDHSPLAVASLADHLLLKSPKDFEMHSVAAPLGSAIRVQLPALFRINHVDASKVKLVHIPGSAFVQTLFRGDVDITSAFLNESGVALQIQAEKAGKKLSWLRFSDYGLDVYAATIITSDRLIKKNPGLVSRMVGALAKGYAYMAAHPKEAAQIMLKHEPALPSETVRKQVSETIALAQSATFKSHGYGYASAKKLETTVDVLSEAMGVKKPKIKDVHTNAFLPSK